jgi:D-sedoheptulose 7-phosphate isomerase
MVNPPPDSPARLEAALADAHEALAALREDRHALDGAARAIDLCASALRGGGKVLACGNGGSLCDAMHFCEELTGRFRADRAPLAAIACIDPGHITCTANDYGYEHVFARWVRALGRKGDVLVVLSTSGNSPNCLLAADAARQAGVATIALLGKGGGALRAKVDVPIVVPGQTADRIQEIHMLLLHAFVEGIEEKALGTGR